MYVYIQKKSIDFDKKTDSSMKEMWKTESLRFNFEDPWIYLQYDIEIISLNAMFFLLLQGTV